MSTTEIRLRVRNEETLILDVPDGAGGHRRVPVAPADVQRMYDGLTAELPSIYGRFEDPVHGEMTASFPYATPVTRLSNRVPPDVLRELGDAARQAQGGTAPVLLLAEKDPFPWELVRPDPRSPMVGQTFDVARFEGVCAETSVIVSEMLVIAPVPADGGGHCDVEGGTFGAQHTAIAAHVASGHCQLLDCLTATQADTLRELGSDAERIVHYMGHHFHDKVDPGRSVLQLAGDESLTPAEAAAALGLSRTGSKWPWVFLNCCKGLALRQLGNPFESGAPQWGSVLLAAGARAAIGPYWRVEKSESFAPTTDFVRLVKDGRSLGAALRTIRLDPSSPTKLAFTMVGDPTTKVTILQ